ncbi:MAG TPA: hypothetical protein VFI73_04805 [Candidatus Nitrosopolaris sp.]|nr:hypothetical protein [Candidatus Nitrosopolaris sp.]
MIQWLSGDSRDRITADNGIGAGTVSNIINEWKKGIEDSDYDSVRELAVFSKKEGFGLSEIASSTRLSNYIQKLGVNQDQIESFIANLVNSPEPEKLMDVANQVAQLLRSESIPLEELEGHVKQQEAEKQWLEDEIKQRRATLESLNVEIQIINEYKQLKSELSEHHFSSEDPTKLVTVLNNIRHYGYDPKKIVAELSNIKSLKRRENALQHNCKLHEERMARCREVLPLCEQIVRLRIGIGELLAFHTAVCEKAERFNLSKESASYRVIDEIDNYNRIGGLNNEITRLAAQRYAMNETCASRNKAISSLLKLQNYGITDDEISNVCEFLNRVRVESAATIRS